MANGPGIRTSLFVTGCPFKCSGCFNEEYFSYNAGKLWDVDAEKLLFEYLGDPHVKGFSVLGGEPLNQDDSLLKLLIKTKKNYTHDIWIWTGFTYENLNETQRELVSYADVLVDGQFIETQKDLKLKFRGSSNQRIIDLNKTRKNGSIVLWDESKISV